MDKEFFQTKINELSDSKLKELLWTSNNRWNREIFELAKQEAGLRNLTIDITDHSDAKDLENEVGDMEQLKRWNWGALFLAPLWALANKLDKWAVLCFVPFVNIIIIFYLGFHGNRLAFEKSKIHSVNDFITAQKYWGVWGIWPFCFGAFFKIIALLIGTLT